MGFFNMYALLASRFTSRTYLKKPTLFPPTYRFNRVVSTRENKPRLTLAAAYIIRERNYLYEYKHPGQDKPRLEKAVNVDFVPFIRGVRVLCKPRLIFSRINGPIEPVSWRK